MSTDQTIELDEAILTYLLAVDSGETPNPEEWLARYPQFADELRQFFAFERRLDNVGALPTPFSALDTPSPVSQEPAMPEGLVRAGRFELAERIGHGGIGDVFRAFDSVLGRLVAVKVLQHRHRRQPQ